MSDNDSMFIASVTVTKLLEGDDVSIHVDTEPEGLALIDILGMLAFAQHATAIDNMPPYEPED